jgi:uncharacterized membrane protein (UPF0182 family)
VELGEVDIVPIDQALLYVQTVYVESSTNQIPTLRDVVVVYNGTAYHSGNASLDNALCQIQNPDGSSPFSNYCNTAAATSQIPSSTLPAGSTPVSPTPSTTTTVPTSVPPASKGATVPELLASAKSEFAAADAALRASNLATYQTDVNLAETYVAQAAQLAGKSP